MGEEKLKWTDEGSHECEKCEEIARERTKAVRNESKGKQIKVEERKKSETKKSE